MPLGKSIVDRGPVAVLTEPTSSTLPAIIDLHVVGRHSLLDCPRSIGLALDFVFVDLLIEEVPGTPAGRRQGKVGLIDRLEVFDLKSVAIIVLDNGAVFELHFVSDGIEMPSAIDGVTSPSVITNRSLLPVANACGNWMRPGSALARFVRGLLQSFEVEVRTMRITKNADREEGKRSIDSTC